MRQHHFHLVFARRADGPPPRFLQLLEHEARARGMVFFHCQNHEQAETLRHAVLDGTLQIDCLIDYMGRSFQSDTAFGRAVKDGGGLVVDDPDRVALFGDKAVMHQELARVGVPLPRTLVWQPWLPSRDLTAFERALLGPRMVCKPARGSGGCGVQLDFDATKERLDAAREDDPDDAYLLQEFVEPLALDGRPAWFRVYNCFGRVFVCFWHPETHATELVSPEELDAYDLHELTRLSRIIARISGYTWFSSEIALATRDGQPTLLPIDYLNNKCFMLTHSEFGPRGIPDRLAAAVAREMVEQAARHGRQRAAVAPLQYAGTAA